MNALIGKISSSFAVNETDCDVVSLVNGNATSNSTLPGSMAEYTCDNGYFIKGPTSRVCQSDSMWSGLQPQCFPGI